jgi:hypothetical protein
MRPKIEYLSQSSVDLLQGIHRLVAGNRAMGVNTMSILESLVLSEISKKAENTLPHMVNRRKMIVALDEQIAGATAEASGQHFSRSVEKWVKTENGGKERRTVERPLRKMWWKSADGIMLELKFALKPVKIGTGNRSSIVVGSIDNLVPVLEKVKQAVIAGELDGALKAAAERRKRPVRVKKDGKPVGNGAAASTVQPTPTAPAAGGKLTLKPAK